MGLLDNILSEIDNRKRVLYRNLWDAIGNPSDYAAMTKDRIQEDRYGSPEGAQAMKQYLSRQPYDANALAGANDALRQGMIDQGASAMGAIRGVWHGSPHKFDKFDMSKIGTGEGAQAYGHGLYMAESPDVAKQYFGRLGFAKKDIGKELNSIFNEKTFSPVDKSVLASEALYGNGFDNFFKNENQVISEIRNKTNRFTGEKINALSNLSDDELLQAIKKVRENNDNGLYKTNLVWPDPAKEAATPLKPEDFLHWDKTMAEQSPAVLSALRKMNVPEGSLVPEMLSPMEARATTGDAIHRAIAGDVIKSAHVGPNGEYVSLPSGFSEYAKTSEILNNLGIPGIRYLDGGSRDAGKGSYNYVLFNDQMPQIVERNGKPFGLLSD